MKGTRRAIDAAVVAVLFGPMRRWLLGRFRKSAKDYARARVGARAQAAWQASALPEQLSALTGSLPEQLSALTGSLPEQLAALRSSAMATSFGIKPRRDRRDIVVTALLTGVVAAAAAATAFAIAVVVRRRRRSRSRSRGEWVESSTRRVAVPVVVPGIEPEDELRSIRGIGSVSAERLHAIGITTVAQIAAWRPEDIQRIAEQIELSPERIEREDWVGQARAISGVESATDLA